ncbi:acyl-homoserine-lactone synthase [Gemmobacter sp. 24YEA27]|uniref:acyl-homoserine-lactone synthase n=1 Tax=Gemmobacter sp. 24YEA27 TaxID=3040672 RepID=UPI0024B34E99|nr:acyl-homoserine-lactone synthase [Gemmobacter sp. 24YEA27]
MYGLRARVFSDASGWDVSIEQGREIDRFDHLDPLYLVGLDTEGEVISCVRLLRRPARICCQMC